MLLLGISVGEASAIKDLLLDIRGGYEGLEDEIEEAIEILSTILDKEEEVEVINYNNINKGTNKMSNDITSKTTLEQELVDAAKMVAPTKAVSQEALVTAAACDLPPDFLEDEDPVDLDY